jgi:hypothetical protein
MARKNDVGVYVGDETDTPTSLAAWLAPRAGHKIVARWKDEETTHGPLHIIDRTEADADPRNKKPELGIPYGASYACETEWITRAQAKHLMTTFNMEKFE